MARTEGPCPCSLLKHLCLLFNFFGLLEFCQFEVWIFVSRHPIVPSMRRLVQLSHPKHGRQVAVVEENGLRLLRGL